MSRPQPKRVESDDPMELLGVVVPADAEATRDMAYVFAEEFARLGYSREQLLWLFKNPFYGGAHGAYRSLGEKETLTIIDECIAVWGSIQIRIQDAQFVSEVPNVAPSDSPSPALPGEKEGAPAMQTTDKASSASKTI